MIFEVLTTLLFVHARTVLPGYLFFLSVIPIALSACATPSQTRPYALCSTAWYEHVETTLVTSDGHGHGPDLGSVEWKSVVEFKLGVRGKSTTPNVDSQEWCAFIDNQLRL